MKKAFTLAEVLITLVIIGVVAALTIPTLMNKIEDAHFKSQYKKLYATFSQALVAANGEGCSEVTWKGSGSYSIQACIVPKLKYIKTCKPEDACWTQLPVKGLNGSDISSYDFRVEESLYSDALVLPDGVVISLSGLCSVNATRAHKYFLVDLNGLKEPNTLGRDIHNLVIESTPTNIFPVLRPYYSSNKTSTVTPVDTTINNGCLELGNTSTENRGYTCGIKWLMNN